MSKRKDDGLNDALADLMGSAPNKTEPKEAVKKPPANAGSSSRDPLVTFTLRLPKSQKEALTAYFLYEEGLDLGPGIRSLLTKFQREKGI